MAAGRVGAARGEEEALAVVHVRLDRLRRVELRAAPAERRLRVAHGFAAGWLLVQAIVLAVVVGEAEAWTVTGGALLDGMTRLDPRVVLASGSALAAAAPAAVASPVGFPRYVWDVRHRGRRFRRTVRSVAVPVATLVGALTAGVTQLAALAALVVFAVVVVLAGWRAEDHGRGRTIRRRAADRVGERWTPDRVGWHRWTRQQRYNRMEAVHLALVVAGVSAVSWVAAAPLAG
jgi:hypothetical protein